MAEMKEATVALSGISKFQETEEDGPVREGMGDRFIYKDINQINKYINNVSKVSHCWKRELQIKEGGKLE